MSGEGSITQWLGQIQEGDSLAAQRLWERYYRRLTALAHKKLRDAPRRAADEEDVVQSAFKCFYQGVEAGRFPKLDDRDDLWRILVTLTANKAINQFRHETRLKRNRGKVRGESVFQGNDPEEEGGGIDQVVGGEPTPEFAALVASNLQELLDELGNETLKQVALWRMEGFTNREIADRLGCKERTVERKLHCDAGGFDGAVG